MVDNVNSPAHYTNGEIECIDAIESSLTLEEFRGYMKGNVLKYVWRERSKGGTESLEKAEWYLKRLIRTDKLLRDVPQRTPGEWVQLELPL